MTRPKFLSRYIRPFYMDLMKMNFVEKSEDHTNVMALQLKELGNELSDAQLSDILNDTWRLSKVGAWMIGIGNRTNLKNDLEKYLLITPSDYSEHILINLYFLDKQRAGLTILEFIERQTKYFNSKEEHIELV